MSETALKTPDTHAPEAPHLRRELGLFSAITLVTGIVIGSGIFIVSADIARQLGSPGLLMANWLFVAVVTMFGAMSYGKLAAAYPEAGGQYVFLKKAWGEIPAFLYGWALFFVIQTGTLAAVAVGFSKFLGVLLPAVSSKIPFLALTPDFAISTQQAVSIGVLLLLTLYNCVGVKEGAMLNNIFTTLKVAAVLGLIAAGFFAVQSGLPNPASWVMASDHLYEIPLLSLFAVSCVGSMFAADAWNNVTFVASEIKNPEINLPKALVWGTALVLVLYLLVNVAYLNILPFGMLQNAPEDRVATAAMQYLWGDIGQVLMAITIMISTFGCLNGMILAGARVFYAMAKDRLFFASFQKVHPKFHTPVVSLIGQGLCAAALTLSGSYGQLLDYCLFTTLLFYLATVIGMIKLGKAEPEKLKMTTPASLIIPVLYLAAIAYISINLAIYKQQYTLPGLMIVGAGIPIYFIWKKFYTKAA